MSKMKLPMDLAKREVKFDGAIPCPMDDSYGPTIHFEWSEDYEFPDVGVLTARFRVKRRNEDIRPSGEKRYEVCIELLELQKVKTEEKEVKPANARDEAGEALDALRAEYEDED